MRVVVAGAHGQVARRLVRRLADRGDEVLGLVRNPDHVVDVVADGGRGVVVDLESASVEEVSWALADADAVVFAAGAGPGSGAARKDTVDRGGAVLLADAAERAGVRRYVLVSSMGVERVRDGAEPDGVDEVFLAYLRAKLAAEDDLRSRDLDWTVLRPGRLTDEPATGDVWLQPSVPYGEVPRDDVAAVVVRLLDDPTTSGQVLELTSAGAGSSSRSARA
ncbi:MAG: SDR family oxidoreductase [Actinomycetes bacterium]